MGLWQVFLIAIGLAMDAFAVSIAAGLIIQNVKARQVFRLSLHFGVFQALMPLIGWAAGTTIAASIAAWDHWAAFALLLGVGLHAIKESFEPEKVRAQRGDPTRGLRLVVLSVATSLDALAVGLSLGILHVPIVFPVAVIGLVAAFFTALGMLLGRRLGASFGRKVEILGGLVLVAIGVKILLQA